LLSTEVIITAFLGIALAATIISQRIRQPYTVVLVFIGILLAASSVSKLVGVDQIYNQLVSGGLLVGLVLPPLLFETMMGIDPKEFRAIVRPALRMATIGVVIATVAGGLLLWLIARLPIYSAFLFAALIAPTDTATVLEIFRRTKVPSKLVTMMDTEAVFNDATGITIFAILLGLSQPINEFPVVSAALQFLLLFGGGAAVGVVVGLTSRAALRVLDDPVSETVLTLVAVYGSYSLASALGFSGLIAVAVAGISYAVSSSRRGTAGYREQVRGFWRILAFIANSAAFLIIGLSTDLYNLAIFIVPIGIAFVVVLLARFVSVYSVLGLSKIEGRKIPRSWKGVATLGGMRGALSIVLAASLPATIVDHDLIVTAVLGIAFISIVFQGYFLTRYVKRRFPAAEVSDGS
jgi:monovalent cation:H+ antiporter, CPA1 family